MALPASDCPVEVGANPKVRTRRPELAFPLGVIRAAQPAASSAAPTVVAPMEVWGWAAAWLDATPPVEKMAVYSGSVASFKAKVEGSR